MSLFSYSEAVSSAGNLGALSSKSSKLEHCTVSLFSIQACLGLPLHMGHELLDYVNKLLLDISTDINGPGLLS